MGLVEWGMIGRKENTRAYNVTEKWGKCIFVIGKIIRIREFFMTVSVMEEVTTSHRIAEPQ